MDIHEFVLWMYALTLIAILALSLFMHEWREWCERQDSFMRRKRELRELHEGIMRKVSK